MSGINAYNIISIKSVEFFYSFYRTGVRTIGEPQYSKNDPWTNEHYSKKVLIVEFVQYQFILTLLFNYTMETNWCHMVDSCCSLIWLESNFSQFSLQNNLSGKFKLQSARTSFISRGLYYYFNRNIHFFYVIHATSEETS